MNNEELRKKVRSAAAEILHTEAVISPVNLLMKTGVLSKKDYEDWRMGRISNLERVCRANLSKLSIAMKELRKFARENNLKPSKTVYKKWGKRSYCSSVNIISLLSRKLIQLITQIQLKLPGETKRALIIFKTPVTRYGGFIVPTFVNLQSA